MSTQSVIPTSCSSADITCQMIVKLNTDRKDMQTEIYIVAGAFGGAILVIILMMIILSVKMSNLFKKVENLNFDSQSPNRADELAKRGFSTYTGNPIDSTAALYHEDLVSPISSEMPKPKHYGYDNVIFDQSRHNAGAGGVRVLPTNPPPNRNNNREQYY